MKKIFFLSLIILATVSFSCKKGSKKEQNSQETSQAAESKSEDTIYDMHNAENSLDYFGVYKGTLPCADCSGINITVTLSTDNSFKVETVCLEKSKTVNNEKGKFNLNEGLLSLYYENGNIEYYMVGEGRLIKLDKDKNYIEGENADMYVLNQEEIFD